MIRFLVFSFLYLSSQYVFGQMESRNTSLEQPSELVLYRNMYNLLGFKSQSLDSITKVLIENDTVQRHVNTFFIAPDASHKSILISVVTIQNDTTHFSYEVRDLPLPILLLGDQKSGSLKRAFLLENPGLLYEYPSTSLLPFTYPVKCELVVSKKKGKDQVIKINGNAFSDKQLKQLSKLDPGTILLFKNSISSCSTCLDSKIQAELRFELID